MPDRAWEELVAEGRQLDKREGELRFAWGDWALKVAPMGTSSAHTGRDAVLRQAMDDAGIVSVSFQTMLQFRRVAFAWPQGRRRPGASWSCHDSLAGHHDRFTLIQDGMTVDQARRLTGAPAHRPADAAGQAAVISKHLKDPAVVAAIAADPQFSSALHLASGKVGAQIREAHDERRKQEEPQAVEAEKLYRACSQLHGAAHRVRVALSLLRDVNLDDDSREMIRADVNQITTGVDWLTSYIDSGNRSFEAELAELLTRGAE